MNIPHLDFGRQAAENEQSFLPERFVPTNAYNVARDERRKKTYYIGNRGAGKSALLKQLVFELGQPPGKNVILEFAPSRFAYEFFKGFEYDFFDIRYMYMAAWEYTIYIEIFKRLVSFYETHGQKARVQEHIEILRNYLEANELLETPGGLDTYIRFLKLFLEKEKDFKSKGMMSGVELLRWLNKGDMPLNALRIISQQYPIYVFVDELDRGWDNSLEAVNFLNGLFAAVESIEQLKGAKIQFYVSLRKDMFNNMNGVILDDQKMRDNIQRISWDVDSLKTLISKRIQVNLRASERPNSDEETLRKVFNRAALSRIFDLTLTNPREVIRICNMCAEHHVAVYPKEPARRIDMEVLSHVEQEFADERYRHFCDEYRFEFPYLKSLLTWFEFGKITYSKAEFLAKIKRAMEVFYFRHSDHAWIMKYHEKPLEMMIELYETGFLKFEDPVLCKFYGGYDYSRRFPSLENIQRVRIHDVFALALRCSENSTFDPERHSQPNGSQPVALPQPSDYPRQKTTKKVFISYAREDAEYVKKVRKHLKLLEHENKITVWTDHKIEPGELWNDEITAAMDEADLAILLLSADFFDSDFIFNHELPALLRAASEGRKTLFPLHVRPSMANSYEPLARLQSINPPEQPLELLPSSEQDRFLVLLAEKVNFIIEAKG